MATTAARVVFELARDDEPAARCAGQLARRIMGMGFVTDGSARAPAGRAISSTSVNIPKLFIFR